MKFLHHSVLALLALFALLGLFTSGLSAQEPNRLQELAFGTGDQTTEPERRGPTDAAEFEAFMDGVMQVVLADHNAAGAVVSAVSGGEVFFAKGYGYSDREARTPVNPETTLFRIGSVSKLFVWTSVMQAVEAGLLDLNTDINEYLDFEIPPAFDGPVTLANIMAHAAGFEDHVIELFGDEAEDVRPLGEILSEQIPARVRPNGDISSYSNHATGMAAYMVERVSGTEWNAYIEQNILQPLGMEYTTFRQPLPEELEPFMSKGYRSGGGSFTEEDFEYVPLAPVGAAAASALDMANFMMAHLQLGRLGEARILSEETARLMQSDHHQMEPGVVGMAHGFMGFSTHGERIIGHGGDTQVFHTGLWLFPEHDFGLFVSFNSTASGGGRTRLFAAFMDRYFPVAEEVAIIDETFRDRADRFTGEFRANRFSHSTIAKLAAVQTTSVGATDRGTLRALGSEWIEETPLTFREEFGTRHLIFREDDEGNITHFLLSSTPIMAWERPPGSEGPALNLVIFALALATMGISLLGPFLGWGIRKWHRVPAGRMNRISRGARISLRLAAWMFAVALVLLLPQLVTGKIAVEIPDSLWFGFLLLFLAAIPTLASMFFAFRMWLKGEGRFTVRVLYSVGAVSLCLFLWQLNTWNLLGWKY